MQPHLVSRRMAIKQIVAYSLSFAGGSLLAACEPSAAFPACEPSSDDPPIAWGPSIFAPVFYGYADYNSTVGAPTNLRVYYPSLDGAPQCAPFLTGPGRFQVSVDGYLINLVRIPDQ